MTDRYARIRDALAMGPTPGPWDEIQHEGSRWTDICQGSNRRYATPIVYVPPCSVLDENGIWKESKDETIANAKHVAACDPDTIRELLAERDQLAAEIEAMRAEVDALRGALKELITWIPSADTYRHLGFDPEAPMRALGEARAALSKENRNGSCTREQNPQADD